MKASNEHLSVQQFIEAFQRGDSACYKFIRRKIAQYVNYHMSGGADQREELASEVLTALADNFRRGSFRGDSIKALNVYLFNMIRNRVIAYRKKAGSLQSDNHDRAGSDPATEDPSNALADMDLAEKVFRALDTKCAELLRLRFQSGWSNPEIAESLRMTVNAVSTAITRCLDRARNLNIVRDLLQ
jgi:RNA polymerase sigma factor (sigma-70 family)